VKKPLAVVCYPATLAAVFHFTHSTSGFLILGLGSLLLLDRYAIRSFPWGTRIVWIRELSIRALYLMLGGVGFYYVRPGIVPLWEAVFHGFVLSLVMFVLESLVDMASRGVLRARNVGLSSQWQVRIWISSAACGLFCLTLPYWTVTHPLHTVPKRTPAAFGLEYEDIYFHTADGIKLSAWLVPHEQPRANVIFCHGHGRNRGHVAGFLELLHSLGCNVLAFDFRGHGDSQGHTSTFGDREVKDLVAAASWISERFPNKPLFLVGVSLGAAVSLQALPQLPNVQGVWSEGAFGRLSGVIANKCAWMPHSLCRSLVTLYDLLGWLDCGFWASRIRPVESIEKSSVPICFCHGMQDELIPFAEGQALYEAYRGPKYYYWVEGGSHYNLRQHHRDEYLDRLRSFLEDRLREINT
jgi:uncharacterized protein